MSQTSKSNQSAEQDLAKLSLSELMEQLEAIVAWFNTEDVDIDQATAKFDQGVKLAEVIRQRLAETDNKINQIKLRLSGDN